MDRVEDRLQLPQVLVRRRRPVLGQEHLALTVDVDDVHTRDAIGQEHEVLVRARMRMMGRPKGIGPRPGKRRRWPALFGALTVCGLQAIAFLATGSVLAPVVAHIVLHGQLLIRGEELPPAVRFQRQTFST